MENFAKKLAINHNVSKSSNKKTYPLGGLRDDYEIVSKAFDILSESIAKNVSIQPSGEWLLDNFYIIEEQYNALLSDLTLKEYSKLPSIDGTSRIYILAEELIKFTDGNITEDIIENFINAYQTKRTLMMEEIWKFPIMIRICLIGHIRTVCDKIIIDQLVKFKVESLIERVIKNKDVSDQQFHKYKNINLNGEIMAYIEYLIYSLKKLGQEGEKFLEIVEDEVIKAGTSSNEIIKIEHYDMATRRVSMSNSITSIKNISRYNWAIVFEKINNIESILMNDDVYKKMDFDTRNMYRDKIKEISKMANVSEIYVANKVIELSKEENKHIGFFLFDDEKSILHKAIGCKDYKNKHLSNNFKLMVFILSIYVPAIGISILIMKEYFWIGIIPFSEVFTILVNKIAAKLKKPKLLPRLELTSKDVATFVIVPALLNNIERVKNLIEDLEVYYLANKDANLYFCLLGDASEIDKETTQYDEDIKNVGISEIEKLNKKYGKEVFYFVYRKRVYNARQGKWLGYERKRGMITEFNNFLVTGEQGTFMVNTVKNIPKIKYIITLDADTELILDSAQKLIGIMEHPLNTPVIKDGIVVKGYGLIQPKIGVSIKSSTASLFAKIFAGNGGLDMYSGAESNIYQDLFGEAIFTGKGIFNVEVFQKLLNKEIPENTVLSHDLLEGSYLRVGLATDIELIDGFPARVNAYMLRLKRWTRGDWQIIKWLASSKINAISKYKIFDNLRRSVFDIANLILLFFGFFKVSLAIIFFPVVLDFLEMIFNFRRNFKRSKNFFLVIGGVSASFYRCVMQLIFLPYKSILLLEAIIITLYRMIISKKHLLEWVTAADAEKILGKDLRCYLKEMVISPMIGCILLLICNASYTWTSLALFIAWTSAPFISYFISDTSEKRKILLKEQEKDVLLDVARRTWNYFDKYMDIENNFLPPDNYQENRKRLTTKNTSSTNIGLGLLAIISAKDLGYIEKDEMIIKLQNSINTIQKLEKWHGHLYNWYDITTLEPLSPKFISTVDSGNFVGYLYVVKSVLDEREELKETVQKLIDDADFSYLYDFKKNLFSIGYDDKEKRLVNSYYDLLASEARQASFVAIAKRDIPYKHWFYLGRTLTTVDDYKGLVSWAGTMFEYFMPRIIMKSFDYTLMGETYKFCVYSQRRYAKKLNIPWGISESAFNLQDLNYNYQYKAFGIPWLGLKRGLKDEVVVAPYASILALDEAPKEVIKNIEALKKVGAYDKFGFFESIDYTPSRVKSKNAIVKTYMAHHQGLILLSVNNYLNGDILQERFSMEPQIKATEILLQERVPQRVLFTKEKKEKVKVLKYKDYEDYSERLINKDEGNVNILSGDNYTLLINDRGEGYSETDGIMVTKYNDSCRLSNVVYIKDKINKTTWSNTLKPLDKKVPDEYAVSFSPAVCKFFRKDDGIETSTKIVVAAEDRVELRQLEIKNHRKEEAILDIISYAEPVITDKNNDIAHPVYNSLFLCANNFEGTVILEKRFHDGKKLFYSNFAIIPENPEIKFEIELDKTKIIGRGRKISNPLIVEQDKMFSNSIISVANTAIALKKEFTLKSGESVNINCYSIIANSEEEMKTLHEKYTKFDADNRMIELAIGRSLIENRFLGFKGKEITLYNKILSETINGTNVKKENEIMQSENRLKQSDLWKFGISGDLPIILVKISDVNESFVVKQLINATRYFFSKKIKIDLVILNQEENNYEQYTNDKIYEVINSENANYLLNINGGIHVLKEALMDKKEIRLIYACSDLIIDAKNKIWRR